SNGPGKKIHHSIVTAILLTAGNAPCLLNQDIEKGYVSEKDFCFNFPVALKCIGENRFLFAVAGLPGRIVSSIRQTR
ncbi:MAG: hypothetical protein AAGI63_02105, partial [Planctomycetota bacterium]